MTAVLAPAAAVVHAAAAATTLVALLALQAPEIVKVA